MMVWKIFSMNIREKRPARTVTHGGSNDAPGSYVFASTTGRAVSPRLKEVSNFSVHCRHTPDISSG
jgi:hypothetical protein